MASSNPFSSPPSCDTLVSVSIPATAYSVLETEITVQVCGLLSGASDSTVTTTAVSITLTPKETVPGEMHLLYSNEVNLRVRLKHPKMSPCGMSLRTFYTSVKCPPPPPGQSALGWTVLFSVKCPHSEITRAKLYRPTTKEVRLVASMISCSVSYNIG